MKPQVVAKEFPPGGEALQVNVEGRLCCSFARSNGWKRKLLLENDASGSAIPTTLIQQNRPVAFSRINEEWNLPREIRNTNIGCCRSRQEVGAYSYWKPIYNRNWSKICL